MTTILSYFNDTYQFNDTTTLTCCNSDEKGHYLLLNKTLFYPQGGGQPSDSGYIKFGDKIVPIQSVKRVADEIRHYTDNDYSDFQGQSGTVYIDPDKRLLHAKLHTAGHLLSNIVESIYPMCHGVKGHHYPELSYVEFEITGGSLGEFSQVKIDEMILKYIEENHVVVTDELTPEKLQQSPPKFTVNMQDSDQAVRIIRIGDFPFSPCGGTHVKNIAELVGLKVTKIKIKNNILRISYQLES